MRGRLCALALAGGWAVLAACGRLLPEDDEEAGRGTSVNPSATDGSARDDDAREAAPGDDDSTPLDRDAGTPHDGAASGPCISLGDPCDDDAECCAPSANRCIARRCTTCSGFGQACQQKEDCCAVGAALTCSVGSCCRAAGAPCASTPLECCAGCDVVSGTCN